MTSTSPGDQAARQARQRWNERHRASTPTFEPHPLAGRALAAAMPPGPVAELACGPSGSALALAEAGRRVLALDISDVAIEQLTAEAQRRRIRAWIECVQVDAAAYRLGGERFALVLATLYWDAAAFANGCHAVSPGGLLGWEALATDDAEAEPGPYRIRHGELGARLPAEFEILAEEFDASIERRCTRLLARRGAGG